jgi:hypothetical protein
MKAYGEDIPHRPLRHAVLAFAASLLPQSDFRVQSEHHLNEATSALRLRVCSPEHLDETDFFAAGMLMWISWIKARTEDAGKHMGGVMPLLQRLSTNLRRQGRSPSDMLIIYAPLVYGEARFYGGLPLDSMVPPELIQRRTTFSQRVKYQDELIKCGSSGVLWLSAEFQGLIDALWDLKWLLISYLLNSLSEADSRPNGLSTAMEYVRTEYDDPDLRKAVTKLENGEEGTQNSSEADEVLQYIRLKKRTIDLLIDILSAGTPLEGLLSYEAHVIAQDHVELGQSSRLARDGVAHEFYIWAYVIDLGVVALALATHGSGTG